MSHLSPSSAPAPAQTPWNPAQPGLESPPIVTPVSGRVQGLDLLADLPGNTQLHCGPNADVLAFQDGSGVDLVFNFDPSSSGDVIAFRADVNGSGITSVNQIGITDIAAGAVINLGAGNGFCLVGVHSSQLDPSDFFIA